MKFTQVQLSKKYDRDLPQAPSLGFPLIDSFFSFGDAEDVKKCLAPSDKSFPIN
jgi:hypothetical protein